ncbi:MAG TPA: hypothetical protein VNN80_20830 [Polyangiaceae bacterium]|nr:hypothetical protein [Polyangiaceae bacterium]
MSSEPKSPKPMPSAAEINAYLERSAARTRLRLPLAKGNALPAGSAPQAPVAPPDRATLPVTGRALPVRDTLQATGTPAAPDASDAAAEAWAPFSDEPKAR